MTAFLAAVLAVAAPPATGDAGQADSPKSAYELRTAIRSALSSEARATTREDRLLAVAEVVRLYGELKTDTKIAYRDRVRLRAKLRGRLNRVASDLKRDLAKSDADVRLASGSGLAGAGDGQNVADPGKALVELIESSIRPDSAGAEAGRGVIAGRAPGVAAGGGSGGGIHGGGLEGARAAQAEALIELIQKTVRPETWEVNGGRGTIMYWPGS